MGYVVGIDTGGTYTDAVLIDNTAAGAVGVKRKAKAVTTHEKLESGISESIAGLCLDKDEADEIERVVLSTTLATNAIVEGRLGSIGLIVIGSSPSGEIACSHVRNVDGQVNIKGRIVQDVNEIQVKKAVSEILPYVQAIAVSGAASIRNPLLEQKVREYITEFCDLPVICGHELASGLGFLERTNTAVINAGLLPVIDRFIKAIELVLSQYHINAPVFVVKGDGTTAKLEAIHKTPIDTALSGPASSMIGAINLTGVEHAAIADMGGTTTDTGIVNNRQIKLSADGAVIGGWKLMIKSAKLSTFGLGGDSCIKINDGMIKVGPERVLPVCRGGSRLTPTDIVHCTGEYIKWDKEAAQNKLEKAAETENIDKEKLIFKIKRLIVDMINEHLPEIADSRMPVCAIGAPAKTWYSIANEFHSFNLIIPEHYEVANAIGAATAGIQEESSALIRRGEENKGYLVHVQNQRFSCGELNEAVEKAVKMCVQLAEKAITRQNISAALTEIEGESYFQKDGDIITDKWSVCSIEDITLQRIPAGSRYIQTHITVRTCGNIFSD